MLNLFLLLRGLCHRAGGGEGGAREVDRGRRQGGGGGGGGGGVLLLPRGGAEEVATVSPRDMALTACWSARFCHPLLVYSSQWCEER